MKRKARIAAFVSALLLLFASSAAPFCAAEDAAYTEEHGAYMNGRPDDALYAPSCMGDGDDGELYYSGFTVVTYREGDSETVVDVY